MPTINGTSANDVLEGTDGVDEINGLGGDDIINGRFGADRLFGGDGDDVFVFTGVGFTSPTPPVGLIDGGAGVDTIDTRSISPVRLSYISQGGFTLYVGNQAFAVTGVEAYRFGSGSDDITFFGDVPPVTAYMGGGNDSVTGSGGLTVFCEDGDDSVFSTGGIYADGGSGIDTFRSGGIVDLAAGTSVWFGISRFTNFENVLLTVNHGEQATAYGDAGANRLEASNYAGDAGRAFLYGRAGNDILIGAANSDQLDGGEGNDDLRGMAGDDRLLGGSGDDVLSGGAGNDFIDGGTGRDLFVMSGGAGTVDLNIGSAQDTGDGFDTLVSIEDVLGTAGADTIFGNAASNLLMGGGGDDRLSGGRGSDTLDGGSGIDTALLLGSASSYTVERVSAGVYRVTAFGESDTLISIDRISFDGGLTSISMADFEQQAFDPYAYMVANPDIYAAFGAYGADSARAHYFATGANEGRSPGTFDPLAYVASNPDLISAFGTNLALATQHYLAAGRFEGRPTDSVAGLTYAASHIDLALAFGTDADRALRHYVNAGFSEGRAVNGFNALLYTASNPDLARTIGLDTTAATLDYLSSGARTGRPTATFDGLLYAASNPDLARAFGTNASAALMHYLGSGAIEGRPTSGFDGLAYAAANPDLASVFGADSYAALQHYLNAGVYEGRPTSGFDSVAYLLSNSDLAGFGAGRAFSHWLNHGADEGRTGDSVFGREQSTHSLGTSTSGALEVAGDRDWFETSLSAGSQVTFSLSGAAASIQLYDALGFRVASVPGTANAFNIASSGNYYVVVAGSVGNFGIAVISSTAAPAELSIDVAPAGDPTAEPMIDQHSFDTGAADLALYGHVPFGSDGYLFH